MNKKLLNLFGLKWNPFSQELPVEGLFLTEAISNFCFRIENAHLREGGFASITGEAGTGKSVALRLLHDRLEKLPDVKVGILTRPSSNLADFYREMGELFDVALRPHNRWGGFKSLREAWQAHIEARLSRPVLLIDEAQEIAPAVFNELRLLTSTRFDSRVILSVIFAGDGRLAQKLASDDLVPLASRIRTRLPLEPMNSAGLMACLRHLLSSAGNERLMTAELMQTVCDHSAGNLRALRHLGAELLLAGAQKEASHLDGKLFLEVVGAARSQTTARTAPAARRR